MITNPVKFEIDLSIWQQFKQQFSVKQVLEHKDGKVIALVSCTELDSYYIAYQLAPLACFTFSKVDSNKRTLLISRTFTVCIESIKFVSEPVIIMHIHQSKRFDYHFVLEFDTNL